MSDSSFQEKINKQGREYIEGLRQVVHDLWVKSCEADGIDPSAKFVCFSEDNKYQPFYNQAMRMLRQAEREYEAGGYVGLQIKDGKIRFSK